MSELEGDQIHSKRRDTISSFTIFYTSEDSTLYQDVFNANLRDEGYLCAVAIKRLQYFVMLMHDDDEDDDAVTGSSTNE